MYYLCNIKQGQLTTKNYNYEKSKKILQRTYFCGFLAYNYRVLHIVFFKPYLTWN